MNVWYDWQDQLHHLNNQKQSWKDLICIVQWAIVIQIVNIYLFIPNSLPDFHIFGEPGGYECFNRSLGFDKILLKPFKDGGDFQGVGIAVEKVSIPVAQKKFRGII